jgi:Flp pilus assembly pilin Flp
VRAALQHEEGQALTEYGLAIALLVLVAAALTAATGIGQAIFDQITNQLGNVL